MTDPRRRRPADPSLGTMVVVGSWGAATTVVAYLVSGGNVPTFIGVMLLIGVAQRLATAHVVRRRGEGAPPWWKT